MGEGRGLGHGDFHGDQELQLGKSPLISRSVRIGAQGIAVGQHDGADALGMLVIDLLRKDIRGENDP